MVGACGREKTRRGDSAPSLGACRKKTREAVVEKDPGGHGDSA